MKTQVWTPPLPHEMESNSFCFDDEALFLSEEAKLNKRCTLLGALMAGASYSTLGMSFEIRKTDQTLLVQFSPGSEVQGFPALKQALLEIAVHVDFNVRQAVLRASKGIKAEIAPLMQQLIDKGIADGLAARENQSKEPSSPDNASPGVVPAAAEPNPQP